MYTFKSDRQIPNYRIISDVGRKPRIFTPKNLELVYPLKEGASWGRNDDVLRMARSIGANLGKYHLLFLLRHHKEIPEEYKEFHILFPGTIWRPSGRGDASYFPVLRWNKNKDHWAWNQWRVGWVVDWFQDSHCSCSSPCFYSYHRLARLAQT